MGNGCHGTLHRILVISLLLERVLDFVGDKLVKLCRIKNRFCLFHEQLQLLIYIVYSPPFISFPFSLSIQRATMDYSQRSSVKKSGLSLGHSGSSTCFTVLVLRIVSLLSALLALAAKENGIAALPIAITWDIIRLHQQSAGTWNDEDNGSGRTARCLNGGSKTSSPSSISNSNK